MAEAHRFSEMVSPQEKSKVPVTTIFITSIASQFAQFVPVFVVDVLSSNLLFSLGLGASLVLFLAYVNSAVTRRYDKIFRSINALSAKDYFIKNLPFTLTLLCAVLFLALADFFIPIYIPNYAGQLEFSFYIIFLILLAFLLSPIQAKFSDRMAVKEPALTTRFQSYAARIGIKRIQIYSVPWKPFRVANAFQVGPVFSYAVYVTDLLTESLDSDEQDFVILHEIYHAKRKHILKLIIPLFAIVFLLYDMSAVPFSMLGNPVLEIILVLSYLFGLLSAFPIVLAYLSRRNETEADLFAVSFSRNFEAAETALRKLESINSNPILAQTHRLLRTHPSVNERILKIEELKEKLTFKRI